MLERLGVPAGDSSNRTVVRLSETQRRTRRRGRLDLARVVTPGSTGCEECLRTGDTWVHLRICMGCGHVGCCDESKNRHATRHFQESGHPIVKLFDEKEDWAWCHRDQAMP